MAYSVLGELSGYSKDKVTEPVHDFVWNTTINGDGSIDCQRTSSLVNHPSHYNKGKIEVIDAIEDWKLGFNLGNVVKYVARADHKGKRLEDLKKALWYLQMEINKMDSDAS